MSLINKIFNISILKTIILIFLLIASFCAMHIDATNLCVLGFYQKGSVIYFSDIQGGASEDSLVFEDAAVLGFLFAPIWFLNLRRDWLIGLFSLQCILQFLTLLMVNFPINEIIKDSIQFCGNHWIIAFLVFKFLYIGFSICYFKFDNPCTRN